MIGGKSAGGDHISLSAPNQRLYRGTAPTAGIMPKPPPPVTAPPSSPPPPDTAVLVLDRPGLLSMGLSIVATGSKAIGGCSIFGGGFRGGEVVDGRSTRRGGSSRLGKVFRRTFGLIIAAPGCDGTTEGGFIRVPVGGLGTVIEMFGGGTRSAAPARPGTNRIAKHTQPNV